MARMLLRLASAQCARGTSCGSKGATIQRPGWAGKDIGFQPFPTRPLRARSGLAD
jgi:hypothetical protein